MAEINWIGHASFLLKINGKNVYIDPFRLEKVREHADLILITHPHFDHMNLDDIKKIADDKTEIFVPKDSVDKIPIGSVKGVEPNKRYKAQGVEFRTIPAYNVVKDRLDKHPKGYGWVGYIVNVNGKWLYHAGDTDFIDEMKGLKVDMALLPMSGTYTMDVNQAIEAAHAIIAEQYIPMHYKMVLGKEGSKKAEELFREKVGKAVFLTQMEESQYSF